jgi:hypothetical protein
VVLCAVSVIFSIFIVLKGQVSGSAMKQRGADSPNV